MSLDDYVQHKKDCPSLCDEFGELVNSYRDWGCTCGLDRALAEHRELEEAIGVLFQAVNRTADHTD